MKCGLCQTSLTTMKFTFAGEQAFAEGIFGALKGWAFDESGVMGNQHVSDLIRVIKNVKVARSGSKID
jgi:hypothetical protein